MERPTDRKGGQFTSLSRGIERVCSTEAEGEFGPEG